MKIRPAAKRLLAIVARFPKMRIVVLGDLMQDHFIRGKVSRISPEAPVPVVAVTDESNMPGGAGNVAANLRACGASVSVVSAVGDDPVGRQLAADLRSGGIETAGILMDPDRVTTEKCRIVAEHQQVVRFDRETPRPLSGRSRTALLEQLRAAIRAGADALILSDYGKGIVSGGTVGTAVSAARRAGIPVLVDPKVEHFRSYKGVDCITPNIHEAWGGMRLMPSPDEDAVQALGRRILRELKLQNLLITRGEKGMSLFERAGRGGARTGHIPTEAREVFDVTGAGDTVISVLALALAGRARFSEAASLANLAAGIVVGKLGTATASVPEIESAIRGRDRRPA